MRFVLAIFATLWLAGVTDAGWQSRDSNYDKNVVSGGGSFSGPGDVVSGASVFYSCARAYNAAYAAATGNLCDLVDTATGASSCTLKSSTSGFADLTTTYCVGGTLSVTTFCTVTHAAGCSVSGAYNQSGVNACAGSTSCNVVQATLANMPVLTLSAINSLPCMTNTSSPATTLIAANTLTVAQPGTDVAVANYTGSTTLGAVMQPNDNMFIFNDFGTNVAIYNGSNPVAATTTFNAYHSLQGIFNNATSSITVDGSTTSGSISSASGWSTTPQIGSNRASFLFTGVVCEAGIWPVGFNGTQLANMFSNQNGTSGYNGGL